MKIEKNRNCVSCLGGEHGFEKQFFDANSNQDPALTNILHFARRVPSEMKITKISPLAIWGRPGGMRKAAGGRFEGVRDLQT